jgi:hypothetical protein
LGSEQAVARGIMTLVCLLKDILNLYRLEILNSLQAGSVDLKRLEVSVRHHQA